jgi:hypothetical protein
MMINLHNSQPADWIGALQNSDKKLVTSLLETGMTEEQVAELWLSRTGSDQTLGFGTQNTATNYLKSVRKEFRKLLCGDPSYDELRAKIDELWQQGKTFVVGTIAVAIASVLNVAAGVLTPVVALLLSVAARVSVAAWCNLPEDDIAAI